MGGEGMVRSEARVTTAGARDYVTRLAKHFAHKIDVEAEGDRATFRFGCGTAHLAAEAGILAITVEAQDAVGRSETEEVVESHLLRFAHRESLAALQWVRT